MDTDENPHKNRLVLTSDKIFSSDWLIFHNLRKHVSFEFFGACVLKSFDTYKLNSDYKIVNQLDKGIAGFFFFFFFCVDTFSLSEIVSQLYLYQIMVLDIRYLIMFHAHAFYNLFKPVFLAVVVLTNIMTV